MALREAPPRPARLGAALAPRCRVHGGPVAAELTELGLSPDRLVDFSVNVNPYGPAPSVAEAARRADLARYPDPDATAVRAALGRRWQVPAEAVFFAHGAAQLLWELARHVARSGAPALIVEPAFSEFRAGLLASGGEPVTWRASVERGLALDLAGVSEALGRSRAAAAYLAAPTSPAGLPVAAADVARLADAHPDVLLVLDESFLALSDRHRDADVPLPPNVARVRSMTKEHAIAGLRVGYLLAEPSLVAALEAARPSWSTSAPAQAAALAALAEDEFVAASRARLADDREALRRGLERLGFAPLPSIAPYLAFQAGDAAALRGRLLRRGILVRDCASFGLPGFVRVAARPPRDRDMLLAALEEEVQR
ncbi:MAG TPA: histidinol-phosphate transaminase [Anaeromyxobacter sp.]